MLVVPLSRPAVLFMGMTHQTQTKTPLAGLMLTAMQCTYTTTQAATTGTVLWVKATIFILLPRFLSIQGKPLMDGRNNSRRGERSAADERYCVFMLGIVDGEYRTYTRPSGFNT